MNPGSHFGQRWSSKYLLKV